MKRVRKSKGIAAASALIQAGTDLAGSIAVMNRNPAIRSALIARIEKAAQKAPVIVLHQIAQILEQGNDIDDDK